MKFEEIKTEEYDSSEISSSFELKKSRNPDEEILANFTPEQQKEIKEKQKILSSLAYYISNDYKIPLVLGVPTKQCPSGWMWAKRSDGSSFIQMNVFDLIKQPMDFLRFVISHEGGHARISRFDFVDMEIYKKEGFAFLLNAIEDPRDNNFVAANYPRFAEQMKLAYEQDEEIEKVAKKKAKAKLGYQPRFMLAGFEYIKLWYKERLKLELEISADLSEEIQEIVSKTMVSASEAWKVYPTKKLADEGGVLPSGEKVDGERMITEYAKQSYEIILEEIWPEFQKLVEKDLQDQKMAELMKDLQKDKQESTTPSPSSSDEGKGEEKSEDGEGAKNSDTLPKELKDKLSPEEQKELERAIEKAIEESTVPSPSSSDEGKGTEKEGDEKGEGKKPQVVDMDSLSPELKKKIQDYLDALPEEKKKELAEKAEKAIKDFEKEIGKDMEGKLTENPEEREKREKAEGEESDKREKEEQDSNNKEEEKKARDADALANKKNKEEADKKESAEMMKKIRESLEGSEDEYQKEAQKLSPQINLLKEKLWEIFQDRRKRGMKSGFEDGEEIDVERRLQEKAKGISIFESKAWRRTELPREKDYAISLLVDLSGSMDGERINEAFAATILFTEVLNSLGIKLEVLGFNDQIYEYQTFSEKFSSLIRKRIITMKAEVSDTGENNDAKAQWNDDGWAVGETARRLANQKEKEKLLIVISDGVPIPSPTHRGAKYELGSVVESIIKEGTVKIVGLGLGSSGVEAVKHYYPKHNLVASNAKEMINGIGDLLLDIIKC